MNISFWLVCYDIANPKQLHRMAKIMELADDLMQKNMFERNLSPAS